MSTTRNIIDAKLTDTSFTFNGKITNFSIDKLFINIWRNPLKVDDLRKIFVTAQLKNSKGNNAIIINSVPLFLLAKLSDYKSGFGIAVDGDLAYWQSIAVDLGNIVLEGDDELDVVITGSGLSSPTSSSDKIEGDLVVFGYDNVIGAEQIICYEYVQGSATQTYQQTNASEVYLNLSIGTSEGSHAPSNANVIAVNDFFGRNTITEIEATTIASVQAQSGDLVYFGLVWTDSTGLTQDMSFKVPVAGEEFLVVKRWFDVSRLGMGQQSVIDYADYIEHVQRTDSNKYKCLQYESTLNNIG